jgi:hypothetical protein
MPQQPGGPRERVNFTLTRTAIRLLEETAEALGTSRSGVVEQAIRRFWASEARPLAERLKARRKPRRKSRARR